jgi:rod shape-determining protein MreC
MGQVEDVHLHFATVRLISDPNHALPVQINRTGLRTVAFGSGETGALKLPNVPRLADVREGDLVVTSGLGDRFPGGYPVARVIHIDRPEGKTFIQVEAEPLAALDRGREVLLISAHIPLPETAEPEPEAQEPATGVDGPAAVQEPPAEGEVEAEHSDSSAAAGDEASIETEAPQ